MSPASKSKSKDKKASKEQQKSKATGPAAAASAYNPLSGTFHALESTVSVASPLHSNCRFKNIDDTDAQSGVLLSSVAEYDCVSNTGSWSGESEDHKEKKCNNTVRQETIPGADIDKREKIRQKNEKKHQRQKERRAQELHERCSGYLISRKLESLAQQLVAMGFSSDRATVALMLNEGKIEESVAWLLEGGEEAANDSANQDFGGQNLKIDISDELARIADLESQFKCTKQEVERVVITSEGDLEKAAKSLRELKLDPPAPPPKPEETGDPPTAMSSKFPGNTSQALRPQANPNSPPSIQPRKEEKDFNYTKGATITTAGMSSIESLDKNIPDPLMRSQPKMEWGNYEQITTAEKRWPSSGTSPTSSFSLASPAIPLSSAAPIPTEARYVTAGSGSGSGSEFNSLQSGSARESSSMVQSRNSVGNISSSPPSSWYSAGLAAGATKASSEFLQQIRDSRNFKPPPSDVNLNHQMYPQAQYQQQQRQPQPQQWQTQPQLPLQQQPQLQLPLQPQPQLQLQPPLQQQPQLQQQLPQQPQLQQQLPQQLQQHPQQFVHGNNRGEFLEATHTNTSRSRMGASSSIAAASSLGLFSGANSFQSGATPPVDWNSGSLIPTLDYSEIDWSVDKSLTLARASGVSQGFSSSFLQRNANPYESNTSRPMDARDSRYVDARDSRFMDARDSRFVDARDSRFVDAKPFVPSGQPSNYSRVPPMVAMQNRRMASETPANSSREWGPPFEGNDMFNFPRQYGSPPPPRKFYDNK